MQVGPVSEYLRLGGDPMRMITEGDKKAVRSPRAHIAWTLPSPAHWGECMEVHRGHICTEPGFIASTSAPGLAASLNVRKGGVCQAARWDGPTAHQC